MVINALVDALKEFGIDHIDMPATPLRVWTAIQQAGDIGVIESAGRASFSQDPLEQLVDVVQPLRHVELPQSNQSS